MWCLPSQGSSGPKTGFVLAVHISNIIHPVVNNSSLGNAPLTGSFFENIKIAPPECDFVLRSIIVFGALKGEEVSFDCSFISL